MKKAFMRAMVCALCGALAFMGVNIPCSVAESNTKEVNQIDEKYVVASYPNILNLDSDVMALYKENEKNYFYTFEKCFWICLKINGKNTLFLTSFNSLIYDYSSNPTIVPGKMWDARDHNEQYFAEKKQIIENIIKYSDLYEHKKNILFEGDSIMDLFNHTKLIGILVKTQGKSLFFHNTNFFNNKEEVELTFITNNLNELANLISVDLDKCDLPERVKEYMKDSSIELSAMDLYNLYMAIVPDEYLPTLTQKQLNINPSLPIFKDEILKKEIDNHKEKMGIKYFETGSGKSKYLAFYLDHKTKAYYDFFTREKIVNYDGKNLNEEYRNKIDYVNKNEYEELRFLEKSIHTSSISLMEFDYYFPELRYLFTYMSTYGDFVDFYQKIPLEQQIDYSFYDFSKSPIIDQYDPAWFADRPAFVPTPVPTPSPVPTPTPTPPPYQELTLGTRGQAVLDMKGRFFELGYFRTTEFSDQFNKNTADTVKLFEKNNGLPADGVADPTMLALLFSDKAMKK